MELVENHPSSESSVLSQNDNLITILDADYEKANHPPNIKLRLKPHQLTMIKSCRDLELNENITIDDQSNDVKISTRVGVIGDLVGSGKTLTILGIIASSPFLVRNRIELSTCNTGVINISSRVP